MTYPLRRDRFLKENVTRTKTLQEEGRSEYAMFPDQIIGMLRQAQIDPAGGRKTGEVLRFLGIVEQSYYRWRKSFAGI